MEQTFLEFCQENLGYNFVNKKTNQIVPKYIIFLKTCQEREIKFNRVRRPIL